MMRTKRRLCIVAALVVLGAIGGCVWVDYQDDLGTDNQWNIPDGYEAFLATIRTDEGLKDIVILRDRDGKCWYRDSEGRLKPVQGEEK